MGVTLKDIAERVGVTATTVSYALRNKPLGERQLAKQTKDLICKVAEEMGYKPNNIGRALSLKKNITIGVVVLSEKDPMGHFCDRLLRGVEIGSKSYIDYGLVVKTGLVRNIDPNEQAQQIYNLISEKVDGICVSLLSCPEVKKAIDKAIDCGIPVVTFDVDIEDSKRLCFVGQNPFSAGQVAADQLCNFMAGKGKVFILSGYNVSASHRRKVLGFESVVDSGFPDIKIVGVGEHKDDESIAFEKCCHIMKSHPDLNGIYIATGTTGGAGRAVKELGKVGQVRVVCHDALPETLQLMQDGIVISTIFQDPVAQGRKPIDVLFNLLFEGHQISQEYYYIDIDVYTKHLLFSGQKLGEKIDSNS